MRNLLFVIAAFYVTQSPNPASGQQNYNFYPQQQQQVPQQLDRLQIFDIELLRYTAEAANGNFMISPASLKAILGMILEGAKGNGAEQLRNHLRLPSDQREARNVLRDLIGKLKVRTPGVTVESANKIFLSDRYNIVPEYERTVKNFYLSELDKLNFAQPNAVIRLINGWVNSRTNGRIPSLIESGNFDADTMMVLVNALYFKGAWKTAFNERLTSNRCFYVRGSCVNTPMMEIKEDYNYAYIPELNAQVIDLPYLGDKYSMLIIMPFEKHGLTNSFIKDLSYYPINKILSELDSTEVQLKLPKLHLEYTEDLALILQKLGIRDIFSKNADLSGIVQSDQSPLVNSVVHKTTLEVNEQGAVAAAASGSMVIPLMGTSSARMEIDHPFLFFIRDVESGMILFEGRINEPTSGQKSSGQSGIRPQQPVNTRFEQPNTRIPNQPTSNFQQPVNYNTRFEQPNTRIPNQPTSNSQQPVNYNTAFEPQNARVPDQQTSNRQQYVRPQTYVRTVPQYSSIDNNAQYSQTAENWKNSQSAQLNGKHLNSNFKDSFYPGVNSQQTFFMHNSSDYINSSPPQLTHLPLPLLSLSGMGKHNNNDKMRDINIPYNLQTKDTQETIDTKIYFDAYNPQKAEDKFHQEQTVDNDSILFY